MVGLNDNVRIQNVYPDIKIISRDEHDIMFSLSKEMGNLNVTFRMPRRTKLGRVNECFPTYIPLVSQPNHMLLVLKRIDESLRRFFLSSHNIGSECQIMVMEIEIRI